MANMFYKKLLIYKLNTMKKLATITKKAKTITKKVKSVTKSIKAQAPKKKSVVKADNKKSNSLYEVTINHSNGSDLLLPLTKKYFVVADTQDEACDRAKDFHVKNDFFNAQNLSVKIIAQNNPKLNQILIN